MDDNAFLEQLGHLARDLDRLEIQDENNEAFQSALDDLHLRLEALEIQYGEYETQNLELPVLHPDGQMFFSRVLSLNRSLLYPIETQILSGECKLYSTSYTPNSTLEEYGQAYRNSEAADHFMELINERDHHLSTLQFISTERELISIMLEIAHFEYMYGIDQQCLLFLRDQAQVNGNDELLVLIEASWRWSMYRAPIEIELLGAQSPSADMDQLLSQAAELENRALADAHDFLERYVRQQEQQPPPHSSLSLGLAPSPSNAAHPPPARNPFEIKKVTLMVPPNPPRSHGSRRHKRDRRRRQRGRSQKAGKESKALVRRDGNVAQGRPKKIMGRWVGQKTYLVSWDWESTRTRGFYIYLR